MDQANIIISEGVIMRPFVEQDAEDIFKLIDSNRNELRQWLSWVDDTKSVEDSKKFIIDCQSQLAKGTAYRFGIFENGGYAGIVDLHDVNSRNRRAGIGYWLGKESQGKGIMTKAVAKIVSFGFETIDLNRIEIHVAPGNTKSRAVAGRLGFIEEGQLKEYEWLYDHFEDHIVYAMLSSDWKIL